MSELDWQCEKDYKFTKQLNGAGWAWEFLRRNLKYVADWENAVEQQQMFTEYQAGEKFNLHKNPYVMFDPPLPPGKSPDYWAMKEEVELHAPMTSYSKKWQLNGHMHDPANGSPPNFEQVASTKLLDWEELGEYYAVVSEDSDIQHQTSHIAVVGIDLSRTLTSIEIDLKKIIAREKKRRKVKHASQLHSNKRSNWTTFLRILDAKGQHASLAEIGAVLMPEKDEADAKASISQYIKHDIARLSKPDTYIRIASIPS